MSMTDLNEKLQDEVKLLREKVAQYEAWFRAIDEYAEFDFWFKDADSNYQYVNPHFAKNMGRDKCQLQDVPLTDVFEGDKYDRVRVLDQQIMADGYLNRVVPCDASGKLEMHEEHRFVVKDEAGAPIGLGCFAFEVTEKSLAEETLDQAEKLAQLCSWRWSAETNSLISCSQQMADFLGVSMTETFAAFPKRFETMILPEDRALFQVIKDRIDGVSTDSYEIEYKLRREDGSIIHVREKAEPFSASNGAMEYLGVMQDITRQKIAEQALQMANESLETKVNIRTAELEIAKDEAVKSDQAKTLFLANMSHELRTPLNAIIGFSEIMTRKPPGPNEAGKYNSLNQQVLDSGLELLGMIENILVVADVQNESPELVGFEQAPLAPFISAALENIKDDCRAKDIRLVWAEPEQSYELNCNSERLGRVFDAVLSNAVRFNKRGGAIKVSLKAVPETHRRSGVFIDISDTGIGIGENDLSQIMLPFVQADSSFTRAYGGAGLGLTLAKRWVELHDGKLSIASKLDQGTVVRIFLPATTEAGQHGLNVPLDDAAQQVSQQQNDQQKGDQQRVAS